MSRPVESVADELERALTLHRQGRLDQAEEIYRKIVAEEPRHFDALQLLATIAAQRKESLTALEMFDRVLQLDPHHANSLGNRGNALLDLARHEEALASFDRALAIDPLHADALYNRGRALLGLKRPEEALASFDRALEVRPDYAEALYSRANALRDMERPAEALESYDRAIRISPDRAEAHDQRGNALRDLARFEEALASHDRALEIEPDHAGMHLNRAIVRLLLGDFGRGWPEYESRWRAPGASLPQIPAPRWRGEPLTGRTILLHCEQGLGDTLHFVRYARVLRRQGARAIVACQEGLTRLLGRCEGIDEIVNVTDPVPDCDFWTPLLSVPGVLRTDEASIPGECGYVSADPALAARWKTRLARFPGFRVAIAWQGNPGHPTDFLRSVPLGLFGHLARVAGVRLISLTKGPGLRQIEDIAGAFEVIRFDDLDTSSGPFMDSAAILENVDLAVTCDTSLAHLAGALGVPTWVALAHSPDWRWMALREDSPWYPSLRLFRQSTPGDWDEVFSRIAGEVGRKLRSEGSSGPGERVFDTGCNVVTRARHGVMLLNRHDRYIGRSLDLYGEYSENEVRLLERLVRPGDVVLEGGANIGALTVPLARMVGALGTVIAIEPQRLVFQALCANVALNSLTNVDCRQAALGAEAGEIRVPRLDPDVTNNFGGVELARSAEGDPSPLLTIDGLALPTCRLIKLDVEGMEEAVLRGASETVRRLHPLLYVENDREDRSDSLIDFIRSFGYRLYWHEPQLYRAANFFGNLDNVFAGLVSRNMLAVHPSSDIEIGDLPLVEGPRKSGAGASGPAREEISTGGAATLSIDVSAGELIDRITILEIKSERFPEGAALNGTRIALRALKTVRDRAVAGSAEVAELTRELRRVNEHLWDLEDDLRDHERRQDFGASFVEAARAVYTTNDRRWALKRRISDLLGSPPVEEKLYGPG